MNAGGQVRKRSDKLTIPSCLSVFLNIRLKDLTPELFSAWARNETNRPTLARLVSAFLNWCIDHSIYKSIVLTNPTKNKSVREILSKPKVKNDVLQREQLPAWFNAVKQIQNPVISAYLQTLLTSLRIVSR